MIGWVGRLDGGWGLLGLDCQVSLALFTQDGGSLSDPDATKRIYSAEINSTG